MHVALAQKEKNIHIQYAYISLRVDLEYLSVEFAFCKQYKTF